MTKRFVAFASLFAVVAMFLGLMVTGCSDSDSSSEERAMLTATVGLEPVQAKGYDCPLSTKYLSMGVWNSEGQIVVDDGIALALYGEEATTVTIDGEQYTVYKWSESDNKISMSLVLSKAVLAQSPTSVVIVAYDADGNVLGTYTNSVSLIPGKVTTCDFTAEDAPSFVEASSSLLSATVGFASEVAAKGFDCPSQTKYLSMGVMDDDGVVYVNEEAVAELYGEEAGEVTIEGEKTTVNAWTDNGDGTVTMKMVLSKEVYEQNPTRVVVVALQEDGTELGVYSIQATFSAGSITVCDFVSDDAPEFIPAEDITTKLVVKDLDEDGNLIVYKGQTKEVNVWVEFCYNDEVISSTQISGFDMSSMSENITIDSDKGTIKGDEISETNAVTVSCTLGEGSEPLTCEVNVKVEGLLVSVNCINAEKPDFDTETVTVESMKVNDTEQLDEPVAWESGEYLTLEGHSVGVGDKVVLTVKKIDAEGNEYTGDCEEIEVSEDDANIVLITGWTEVPAAAATVILDYQDASGGPSDSDTITVMLTINDTDKKVLNIYGSEKRSTICEVNAGDKVEITGCSYFNSGSTEYAYFSASEKNYVISSAVAGENYAPVDHWASN